MEHDTFREAVANALINGDYHRLGAVHVRLDDHGLTVSNLGGLVDGVTLDNLVTTELRPRSRVLAALNPITVEDLYSVILCLAIVEVDEAFLRLVIEQENQRNGMLPIGSLIVLAALRESKRLQTDELAEYIKWDAARTKQTLERLVGTGLVEDHGSSRGRSYMLSAAVY